MTQISKYKVSQNVTDQIQDFLFETISNLTNKKQVSDFLYEFLTPTEMIMFTKRLAIGYLIAKEYDQREISRTLKVSTTTVSTFSSIYKNGTSYKQMVDRIVNKMKNKEFLLDIAEGFTNIGAIGGAKSAGYFTSRNEIRKKKRNLL